MARIDGTRDAEASFMQRFGHWSHCPVTAIKPMQQYDTLRTLLRPTHSHVASLHKPRQRAVRTARRPSLRVSTTVS